MSDSKLNQDIALDLDALSRCRFELGWTQAELANRAMLSPKTIQRVLAGHHISVRALRDIRNAIVNGYKESPALNFEDLPSLVVGASEKKEESTAEGRMRLTIEADIEELDNVKWEQLKKLISEFQQIGAEISIVRARKG